MVDHVTQPALLLRLEDPEKNKQVSVSGLKNFKGTEEGKGQDRKEEPYTVSSSQRYLHLAKAVGIRSWSNPGAGIERVQRFPDVF